MIRFPTLKQEKTRKRRRRSSVVRMKSDQIGLFCFGIHSSGNFCGLLRTSGFGFQGSGFRIGVHFRIYSCQDKQKRKKDKQKDKKNKKQGASGLDSGGSFSTQLAIRRHRA